MEFFCTNRFFNSFDKLIAKKPKYGCLARNFYKEYNDKTSQEIFDSGFSLTGGNPKARLIKYRIQSCNNAGKSSGFRVIAFVNLEKDIFYCLEVYPKTGPDAKANINKQEKEECLRELKLEYESVYKVSFNRKKKIIEID